MKGIESLGYRVHDGAMPSATRRKIPGQPPATFCCLVFTLPLMLHMFNKWIHLLADEPLDTTGTVFYRFTLWAWFLWPQCC